MINVLCFGNEFIKGDSLAKKIADELKIPNINFIKCNNPEEVLNYGENLIFLDTIKDITEIKVFDDIDKIESRSIITLHDFDLGFFLKLMKEVGKVNNVRIIGIPEHYNINLLKKELYFLLKDFR